MSETLHGNYQSMGYSENRVYGNRFFVDVASETKNAHTKWISKIERLGNVKVDNLEEADYRLVFCPVKSRIKTDIDEALEKIPEGKPVMLVVMHHTFNPKTIIMESRRHVTRPDVSLTVDCLFYEGELLNCHLNDIAWNQIQNCLGFPAPEVNTNIHERCAGGHWNTWIFAFASAVILSIIIIIFFIIIIVSLAKG